jgi:molybdopterin converting factor small subunit
MVVSVQFCGIQRTLAHTNEIQVPILKNGKVSDVLLYIRHCYPDLPLREEDIIVTVNNNSSNMSHILNPNDKITFLPHIGGG